MAGHIYSVFKVVDGQIIGSPTRLVPPFPEKMGRKGEGYIVVTPLGTIANCYFHKTRDSADKHAEVCNAFWT